MLWLLYNKNMQIQVFVPGPWSEYELLDSGEGRRLERFGKYVVSKPDPSIIWPKSHPELWKKADADFDTIAKQWLYRRQLPESWVLSYQDLKFKVRPTPFKHLGVFPEQAVNWEFINSKVRSRKGEVRVLNLFGYTGAATLVAAASGRVPSGNPAGASVTHVDASRPAIAWAKENAELSKLTAARIRWILDDCHKFVQREARRGSFYDGIILDPPVFGHDPSGKAWDFTRDFPGLLSDCVKILTPNPLFVIVNAYAVSLSAISIGNALESSTSHLGGKVEVGELVLQESNNGRILSTGILARWSK